MAIIPKTPGAWQPGEPLPGNAYVPKNKNTPATTNTCGCCAVPAVKEIFVCQETEPNNSCYKIWFQPSTCCLSVLCNGVWVATNTQVEFES